MMCVVRVYDKYGGPYEHLKIFDIFEHDIWGGSKKNPQNQNSGQFLNFWGMPLRGIFRYDNFFFELHIFSPSENMTLSSIFYLSKIGVKNR